MKVRGEIMLSIMFNWTSLKNTGECAFHSQYVHDLCVTIHLSSHTYSINTYAPISTILFRNVRAHITNKNMQQAIKDKMIPALAFKFVLSF